MSRRFLPSAQILVIGTIVIRMANATIGSRVSTNCAATHDARNAVARLLAELTDDTRACSKPDVPHNSCVQSLQHDTLFLFIAIVQEAESASAHGPYVCAAQDLFYLQNRIWRHTELSQSQTQ